MNGKKKEALTQFNKDNILAAAKKLFDTKGILATTVEDIAKEADYSKSTLYVYFKSKDEILNSIVLEHMILLRELLKKCIRNFKEFESCYQSICKELVRFQSKYPVYFELMLGEIRITREDIEAKNIFYDIYTVGEEINDTVEILLNKGVDCGFIRNDIELIPTVLYLWSGIGETIRFAMRKEEYMKLRLGMSSTDYMDYGFKLLLKSIRN